MQPHPKLMGWPLQFGLPVVVAVAVVLVVRKLRSPGGETGVQGPPFSAVQAQDDGETLILDDDDETNLEEPLDAAPLPAPEAYSELLLDLELPVGPRSLWALVMRPDPEYAAEVHAKNRELSLGQWMLQDGERVRVASYITPLKRNMFGPNEAECFEHYRCLEREDGGWVVEVAAYTPKVPYGDTFCNRVQWYACRDGYLRTRLRVTGQVEFSRNVMLSGVIRNASMEGMRTAYREIGEILIRRTGPPAPLLPTLPEAPITPPATAPPLSNPLPKTFSIPSPIKPSPGRRIRNPSATARRRTPLFSRINLIMLLLMGTWALLLCCIYLQALQTEHNVRIERELAALREALALGGSIPMSSDSFGDVKVMQPGLQSRHARAPPPALEDEFLVFPTPPPPPAAIMPTAQRDQPQPPLESMGDPTKGRQLLQWVQAMAWAPAHAGVAAVSAAAGEWWCHMHPWSLGGAGGGWGSSSMLRWSSFHHQ